MLKEITAAADALLQSMRCRKSKHNLDCIVKVLVETYRLGRAEGRRLEKQDSQPVRSPESGL